MPKKEDNTYKYQHLCQCGCASEYILHIEYGLTGAKAKGQVQCSNCNNKLYVKIYLDGD